VPEELAGVADGDVTGGLPVPEAPVGLDVGDRDPDADPDPDPDTEPDAVPGEGDPEPEVSPPPPGSPMMEGPMVTVAVG
jgi:hypothetical protein